MIQNDRYTYHITWSEEDGEYIGLCAEFASLSWLASERKRHSKEFAKLWLMLSPTYKRTANRCQNI
jgi:hypothetical protein